MVPVSAWDGRGTASSAYISISIYLYVCVCVIVHGWGFWRFGGEAVSLWRGGGGGGGEEPARARLEGGRNVLVKVCWSNCTGQIVLVKAAAAAGERVRGTDAQLRASAKVYWSKYSGQVYWSKCTGQVCRSSMLVKVCCSVHARARPRT